MQGLLSLWNTVSKTAFLVSPGSADLHDAMAGREHHACRREWTPSLARMLATWLRSVLALM